MRFTFVVLTSIFATVSLASPLEQRAPPTYLDFACTLLHRLGPDSVPQSILQLVGVSDVDKLIPLCEGR